MKIFLLLTAVFALTIHASVLPQGTKMSIEVKDQTIRQVIQELEARSEYRFFYNDQLADLDDRVDFKGENITEFEAIEQLLEGQDLAFQLMENNLVLIMPASIAKQQTITGTITDSDGNPIPGVNIIIKGTTQGTISDANGQYTISVDDPNTTLVFSFIGMLTQEIQVGNQTEINITMARDAIGIDEVVAIGYGTMMRKDLSGSVASVKSEHFKNIPATTVEQALVGQVAGVQVVQNGAPGSGATVRIRGIGSTGNNDPLWVVDGIAIGGVYNLNPGDIETIDVLKDASAASIYGSRAANGVILVTTKRGKEGKTNIEFDSYYGFQQVWKQLDVLSGPEFATLANEASANSGTPANPEWANPASLPNTDWQDEIFQNGPIQNYNLNISGGTEKLKAALLINYNNTDGTVITSNYERYSIRINTEYVVNDRLRFGNNTQFSRNSRNDISGMGISYGILNDAVLYQPQRSVYNPDGSYNINTWDEIGTFTAWQVFNPVAEANLSNDKNYGQRILNSLYGELEIVDGLKFKSNLGLNVSNSTIRNFTPHYTTTPEDVMNNSFSSLYWRMSENYGYDFINTLTFEKILGDKHSVSAVVGVEAIEDSYYQMYTNGQDTPNNELQVIDAAITTTGKGNGYEHALLSYFSRVNYIFNDKYFFQFNMRADGSYKFSQDNRWGYFPSGSLAWRVSNEEFMKSVDFMNNLKVRASYGASGNQNNVGDFSYMSRYRVDAVGYSLGSSDEQSKAPAVILSNLGNPDLLWETQVMTDIGVDVGLWNNSVSIVFDYYNKITDGLLVSIPVPSTLGAPGNMVYQNAGTIKNSGIEFAINHIGNLGGLQYGIGANITTINNEVLSLGEGQPIMSSRGVGNQSFTTRTEVGHSVGEFYGYISDGIYQTTSDILQSELDNGAQPGNRKYVDLNNDGVINADDRTYIGSSIPEFFYGINLSASYKGFDFSMLIQGQYGNEILNVRKGLTHTLRNFNGSGYMNGSKELLNRWTGEGTSNTNVRLAYNPYTKDYEGSDWYIEDGSFLRCRSLQVGYTFPVSLLNRLKVDNVRIYMNAQNLFTITNYSSFDPEISNYNPLSAGIDIDTYPVPRTFTMGINLQF